MSFLSFGRTVGEIVSAIVRLNDSVRELISQLEAVNADLRETRLEIRRTREHLESLRLFSIVKQNPQAKAEDKAL